MGIAGDFGGDLCSPAPSSRQVPLRSIRVILRSFSAVGETCSTAVAKDGITWRLRQESSLAPTTGFGEDR